MSRDEDVFGLTKKDFMVAFRELREKGVAKQNSIAMTEYAIDAAKMLLRGDSKRRVMSFLKSRGVPTRRTTLIRFHNMYVRALPDNLKNFLLEQIAKEAEIEAFNPATKSYTSLPYVEALKASLKDVEDRIRRIKRGNPHGTSDEESNLQKYFQMRDHLRKQIYDVARSSEVEAARQDAIVNVGKIAIELLKRHGGDKAVNNFLEAISNYEERFAGD